MTELEMLLLQREELGKKIRELKRVEASKTDAITLERNHANEPIYLVRARGRYLGWHNESWREGKPNKYLLLRGTPEQIIPAIDETIAALKSIQDFLKDKVEEE